MEVGSYQDAGGDAVFAGVDARVDARATHAHVAVERDGAHVEEGADARRQTQRRRHLAQHRVLVEVILTVKRTCQ